MDGNYPAAEDSRTAAKYVGQLKAFTVRDKIEQQLKELKHREQELLKFKALLDKNPDTEQILNLSRNLI